MHNINQSMYAIRKIDQDLPDSFVDQVDGVLEEDHMVCEENILHAFVINSGRRMGKYYLLILDFPSP